MIEVVNYIVTRRKELRKERKELKIKRKRFTRFLGFTLGDCIMFLTFGSVFLGAGIIEVCHPLAGGWSSGTKLNLTIGSVFLVLGMLYFVPLSKKYMKEVIEREKKIGKYNVILNNMELWNLEYLEERIIVIRNIRKKIVEQSEEEKEKIEEKIKEYVEWKERPELREIHSFNEKDYKRMRENVSEIAFKKRMRRIKNDRNIKIESLVKTKDGDVILFCIKKRRWKIWKKEEETHRFISHEYLVAEHYKIPVIEEIGLMERGKEIEIRMDKRF